MCSVFGYVAKQNRPVDIKIIRRIVEANVHRGPHAMGFAWVDEMGRLRSWKAPGNPVRMLGMLNMMAGATMLIGHLRYATHGNPLDNITNHPHPCDGGWIVHNGVVKNYAKLVSEYRLVPVSECDSEVIGILAERSEEKTPMGRLVAAMEAIGGGAVVMGLWHRPRKLVVCRNGNPLHIGEVDGTAGDEAAQGERTTAGGAGGGFYLGSVMGGLPGKVYAVKDQTAICFTCRGMATDIEKDTIRAEKAAPPVQAGGVYRGG